MWIFKKKTIPKPILLDACLEAAEMLNDKGFYHRAFVRPDGVSFETVHEYYKVAIQVVKNRIKIRFVLDHQSIDGIPWDSVAGIRYITDIRVKDLWKDFKSVIDEIDEKVLRAKVCSDIYAIAFCAIAMSGFRLREDK